MADIFISYKRDERSSVEQIAAKLRSLGLSVWFDASMTAGETFNDEIDREARGAKSILVCWSPGARDSDWVKAEAMIGFGNKNLAAAVVAGPDGFEAPTPFNTTHAEDLRAWLADPNDLHSAWRSILRRIGKLCGREDIESWGALDPQANAKFLRNWIDRHRESPLYSIAELALTEREKLEAEQEKAREIALEQQRVREAERKAKDEARAIEEAQRRAAEATLAARRQQEAQQHQSAPEGTTTVPTGHDVMGHPRQLWMLFMTEFWERFAFYGIRWALTLYIVAQFYAGAGTGEQPANQLYGAYLALVYTTAIFGGYVADRVIGYQRSILLGAVISALGFFAITVANQEIFIAGLALIVVGNGLFKPNISTMVGMLYDKGDDRRDRGFTIFYMGINAGALVAPLLTSWLASQIFGTPQEQNYKVVFYAAGIGMLISTLWFWFGRRDLGEIGRPPQGRGGSMPMVWVLVGCALAAPIVYLMLSRVGAEPLAWVLGALFVGLGIMLLAEALREGSVSRDKVIAMLTLFTFNILFWCFFEQAGSSFTFLAKNIVNRDFGGWEFPIGWFQSVNPAGIVLLAPVMVVIWGMLAGMKSEPSIPRKFGLGLIGNALGFLVLMYALSSLVTTTPGGVQQIPFWPLALCYVLQTVGELCLSPIGLSMVTKLAPVKYVGLAMGGWFLSTAIGNNLSGIFAGHVSGEQGITVASALDGFTFSFYLLAGAGVFLFLIAPIINKFMHGVK